MAKILTNELLNNTKQEDGGVGVIGKERSHRC